MKWIVLFLTLALTTQSFADDNLDEQVDVARANAGSGAALSVLSLIMGISGGILFGTGLDGNRDRLPASLGLGIGSVALGAVGIPLSIVGSAQMRKLNKRKLALGPTHLQLEF
jgi:hypothetical protein